MFSKLYRRIYKKFFTLESYLKNGYVAVIEDENGFKESVRLFVDNKIYVFDIEKRVHKIPLDMNRTHTAFKFSSVYPKTIGDRYDLIP